MNRRRSDERLHQFAVCNVEVTEQVQKQLEGTSIPPRRLTGVVDLLYRNSKGWHLVDYKTDRLPLASLCDLYGDQIRQYARHWTAISKEPLVYAGLYSTQLGMRSHDLHEK
jgi:ATP-dependent exoDNAse (exonuclease V) beta subunit